MDHPDEISRNFPYDYHSVMQYPADYYSKDSQELATMAPKTTGVKLLQSFHMTKVI